MLTKKEADELIKIRGESRGSNIKIDLDYVFEKGGEEMIKRVERRGVELGYLLRRKYVRPMDFYPVGLEAITLLCIRDVLNLDERGLEEMGASVVKFSVFMKIFMKYFGSLEMVAREIPNVWKEHYTIGKLEMFDFPDTNDFEKGGHVILRQHDFKVHPIYCHIHKGYFKKTAQMITKSQINSEETKCVFRGDRYNEFLLTWL